MYKKFLIIFLVSMYDLAYSNTALNVIPSPDTTAAHETVLSSPKNAPTLTVNALHSRKKYIPAVVVMTSVATWGAMHAFLNSLKRVSLPGFIAR